MNKDMVYPHWMFSRNVYKTDALFCKLRVTVCKVEEFGEYFTDTFRLQTVLLVQTITSLESIVVK